MRETPNSFGRTMIRAPSAGFQIGVRLANFGARRKTVPQLLLRQDSRRIALAVSAYPSHKAKKVQAYVQSLGGRLEVHFLPPYAPDLNPDEFVWSYAKTNGVSKKPLRENESLKKRVESDMKAIQQDKCLVRSFFCAQSVSYAKD